MAKHIQREGMEQEALFQWANMMSAKFPALKMLYHIPNGGTRNKLEAACLKRQGVKAGVPDIHLPVPAGKFHSLYIELKAGNNKPTKEQIEWIENLRRQGNAAEVCVGWIQAAELIEKYLKLK